MNAERALGSRWGIVASGAWVCERWTCSGMIAEGGGRLWWRNSWLVKGFVACERRPGFLHHLTARGLVRMDGSAGCRPARRGNRLQAGRDTAGPGHTAGPAELSTDLSRIGSVTKPRDGSRFGRAILATLGQFVADFG